jgi:hypothetical protein
MSAAVDTEALFTDVSQVQKKLEEFCVNRAVDANEIYELLETHSFRTDRVQFVTSHLLVTLGLRTEFGKEDIINVSDDSDDDDYTMDVCYASSPECSALDLTVPGLHSIAESSSTENMNANSNSSSGYAEALGASEIDVYPSTSHFQNKTESFAQVHEMQPAASPGADASKPESSVVSSASVEGTNRKHNSEPNNSNDMIPAVHQNDDFICDVNNNDPNNNTEYEFPVEVEDKEELTVSDSGDSEIEFQDEDDARCKLLKEANRIHSIVPKQSLEQVHSCPEANVDCKNRVQIVQQEFLRSDLEPEFSDSAISDAGSVGCKLKVPRQHSVVKIQNLFEPQPCTSSARKIVIEDKNVVKTKILPKPRLCASSNYKMKMRPLKKNAVRELCPSTANNAKINTEGSTLNKQKGMKFEKGKVSKYHRPVQKSFRKVHNASQTFENIKSGIDSEMKIIPPATNPKLPTVWEVSSALALRESAEQNFGVLDNPRVAGIMPTTNVNKQTKPADANNEHALKKNTYNTVRCAQNVGICVSKYHRPVQKSFRKVHNASQTFEDIRSRIDSEMTIIPPVTNPKLPTVWEVSSALAYRESAEQNFGVLDNRSVAGIMPTTNVNDANNERALKKNTSNTVKCAQNVGICVPKPQTLDTIIPTIFTKRVEPISSTSAGERLIPSIFTERVEPISSTSAGERRKRKIESVYSESSPNKNKIGDFDQSYSLPHTDIATNEISLTQNQLKYKTVLMEMFPRADPQYLAEQCRTLDTEESMLNKVTELLERDDFPHRQTPEVVPFEPGTEPSTSSSMPEEERIEMQYETLVAILPNADPMYLRATCKKIGNDEDAMKNFVTQALETKIYPTREDYLKRQETLALKKLYTEQFSIERFLEILPDPFKYFLEEKKNNRKLTGLPLEYLRGRYGRIPDETLRQTFICNKYNLTLTCQKLDKYKGCLRAHKHYQYGCRIPTEAIIPFLQEVSNSFTLFKLRLYSPDSKFVSG